MSVHAERGGTCYPPSDIGRANLCVSQKPVTLRKKLTPAALKTQRRREMNQMESQSRTGIRNEFRSTQSREGYPASVIGRANLRVSQNTYTLNIDSRQEAKTQPSESITGNRRDTFARINTHWSRSPSVEWLLPPRRPSHRRGKLLHPEGWIHPDRSHP